MNTPVNQSAVPRLNTLKLIFGILVSYLSLLLFRNFPALFNVYSLTDRRYQEERLIKGALIAISVGALLSILGQSSLGKSLFVAILLFAIAIPLLAVSVSMEFFVHSVSSTTTMPKFVQFLSQIGGFSSVVAISFLFFHLSLLAGFVFLGCSCLGAFFGVINLAWFVLRDEEAVTKLSSEFPVDIQERALAVVRLFRSSPIPELLRDKEQQELLNTVLKLGLNLMAKQFFTKKAPLDRHNPQ